MRGGGGSDANCGGDKGRGDIGFAGSGVDVVEGREERVGCVRAEVEDAASEGDNGTCKRKAAAPVGQDFAANHVFLDGEFKLSTSGTH
jgi:hypothetical protein